MYVTYQKIMGNAIVKEKEIKEKVYGDDLT